MFATGTPPWHGLGRVVDGALTSLQAIEMAALDWKVEQWELLAMHKPSASTTQARDFLANVRTDTRAVLGVVSRGYPVFQNRDAFDFMDALVGDKLAMFETAGSLRGGRRIWMLARIPKEYHAGPDDPILPYVLLVNSHDGSLALRMIPTTVRVVCQNTLNLALRAGRDTGLTIYHRGTLDQRVREARTTLGIAAARFDRFDEELHAMLGTSLRPRVVEDYFQR